MAKKTPAKRKTSGIEVDQYVLEFKPKVDRAKANLPAEHTSEQLLAEYDRLGGLITYEGLKVKMGSFWDFKANKAVENPAPKVVRKVEVVEESIEEVVVPKKVAKKVAKKD